MASLHTYENVKKSEEFHTKHNFDLRDSPRIFYDD